MKKMTVFIAEDSQNVRDNLKRIIAQIGELDIIGESPFLKNSIEYASKLNPDIFIVDIGLEDGSGIDLVKYLKTNNSSSIIIVFTNYISSPYQIICNKLGADYFLDKTKDLDKLIDILQKIPSTVD